MHKIEIDLLAHCDNRQYIKNMILYNQKGDKNYVIIKI